jgi:protein-L-isoaspartate(D-aspartate) O-methyltransferase
LSDASSRRSTPRPGCARWWSAAAPDSCPPASRRWARACAPIEILPELAETARRNLKRAGFGQVEVVAGDTFNLDTGRDYAVIAVCGALPLYDERFARALAVGGRLFVVVGNSQPQEALLVTRTEAEKWDSVGLFETAIDPLDHAPRPEPFQF